MRMIRSIAVATVALAFAATTSHADHATPAAAQGALRALAQQHGMKLHERAAQGGQRRPAINVTKQTQMDALHETFGKNKNVLQIMHRAMSTNNHTLAMFDGELVHLQTPDQFRSWRLNTWGSKMYAGRGKMYSAFIHLTEEEGADLRARIARAREQQGPFGTIRDAFGNRSMNCASGWCGMPLGRTQTPLHRLIGLGYASGHPQGLQRELEAGGNDRVFGLAVYGPEIADFANAANRPLVVFDE